MPTLSLTLPKKSNIQIWYIAGNAIDSSGITLIAIALANDLYCKDLWLKRNPLGIEGAKLYDYCLRNSKLPLNEHKELVRKLKHGKNIWIIDSIYRNADFD